MSSEKQNALNSPLQCRINLTLELEYLTQSSIDQEDTGTPFFRKRFLRSKVHSFEELT